MAEEDRTPNNNNNQEISKLKQEVVSLKSKIKQLEKEVMVALVHNEVNSAAATANAINPELIEMLVTKSVEMETQQSGRRVLRVIDNIGYPRRDAQTGNSFTINQLIEEMSTATDTAHLFDHSQEPRDTTKRNRNFANPWRKETLNLTKQGQIFKQNPELAEQLKAEANAHSHYIDAISTYLAGSTAP